MTEERRKVLEMLAEGKISAADAERLLDKLASMAPEAAQTGGTAGAEASQSASGGPGSKPASQKPRYLRIMVERPNDKDHLNIRVPLAFARSGSRLLSVLPPQVAARLASHGIDLGVLSSLSGEDLEETLRELNMDISKGEKKVKIFCE